MNQKTEQMFPISFSDSNLSKLRSIRPERRAVLERLFHGDGTKNAATISACFSPGIVFQIGGLPPVTTRSAVEAMLRGFFDRGAFVSLEHEILEVYDLDEALLWRANAVYRLPDGSTLSTPYINRVTFEQDECADYRVHIDLTALQPS